MFLYLINKYGIKKFKLPDKTEESYLFKYIYKNKDYYLNVNSVENKWHLENNSKIMFEYLNNNNPINKNGIILDNNIDLKVIFRNDDTHDNYLFIRKINESFHKYYHVNSNITIGSNGDCNIIYAHPLNKGLHATIKKEQNSYYITPNTNESARVYLNDNVVTITTELKSGDVIFINGIKIIWMSQFLKICYMTRDIRIKGLSEIGQDNFIQNNVTNEFVHRDEVFELYSKNEYFYHTPHLKTIIEDKKITIDSPPARNSKEELPFILSLASRLSLIAYSGITLYNCFDKYKQNGDFKSIIPQLLLATALIIGSFIVPIIISMYHKKIEKRKEQYRQTKYLDYLKGKEREINLEMEEESAILNANNPSSLECLNFIMSKSNNVWDREIIDNDFLTIRLGFGRQPIKFEIGAPEKHFELIEDNLIEEVYKVVDNSKYLEQVPITVSLLENQISSMIFDCNYRENFIANIFLQLISRQSSVDLKIVIFTTEEKCKKWNYLKNCSHCWSDDKKIRYFATNLEDTKKIMKELEDEYDNRISNLKDNRTVEIEEENKKTPYKFFKPYYLIITDSYEIVKNMSLINKINQASTNYGFSFLLMSDSINELPSSCNNFVYLLDNEGCVLKKEVLKQSEEKFIPELVSINNLEMAINKLSNIPIELNSEMDKLPNVISFLEMYNVGKIEQLNILSKWRNNNPIETLQAPIGVHSNLDLFKLDLHEKKHGPHGLIAGSTGSGKSEFIITYILSMAINYHPNEVQFVLIDYKGGGLAGAFENRGLGIRLPHLVGTITNLDKNEMNRTLVSIQSELKRRQQKFNEIRDKLGESTIDIYKYQKLYREGLIDEPISHLFIISDEFAELKSQQPEFMEQLISTARIGRSLGVHLILATQKPSGVVNEQIWSNSRFKVCLKVQSKADSMEMLKRDEAASIKDTGRFYLQVGYDELFEQGQSAWSGAKYIPSDKITKKIDNSIEFLDNVGDVFKKIDNVFSEEINDNQGDQLTNIVKYLINLSKKEGIETKKLWLEQLPEKIYLGNLQSKYNYKSIPYQLKPIIGEYDNPFNQVQGPVILDFVNKGNVLIYGQIGNDKEQLLYTIALSLMLNHSPKEVNLYIVDFSIETMKNLQAFPHVGDVIYSDETEKLNNFLNFIINEIKQRKKMFSEYMGNYFDYIKNQNKKIAQIVIIISGYDNLIEKNVKIEETIQTIIRDANKYGIYFVISTTSHNMARFRFLQLFQQKICLQMNDSNEYRNLIEAPKNLIPAKKQGRGIIPMDNGIFEFQTARLCDFENLNSYIQIYGKKLIDYYKVRVPGIRVLPNNVLVSSLVTQPLLTLEQIPIGIKKSNLTTLNFDFTKQKILPIISNFIDEEFGFINALISEFRVVPNTKVRVIDLMDICPKLYNDVPVYKDDFDTIIQQIDIELQKDKTTNRNTIFLFVGIGNIMDKINQDNHKFIEKVFKDINNCKKNLFILIDNYISYRNIGLQSWHSKYVDKQTGIWLGDGISNQMSIKVSNITINETKIAFKDMAYLVVNGKHILFKHMVDKEKDNDAN